MTSNHIYFLDKNKTVISNIIHCRLWKEIREKFEEKIILPLFLYYDDYESNNPLESHGGITKCGGVHLFIACLLHPSVALKLKNIFLFISFNTLERQVYQNSVVFSKAIYESIFLEQYSIEIDLPEGTKRIYFKLA